METTDPAQHDLPGHGWTVKKLKQWIFQAFGLRGGRGTLRRLLRQANLTWKKVKKLLGKAKPEKRAAHVQEARTTSATASVCGGRTAGAMASRRCCSSANGYTGVRARRGGWY